MLAKHTAYMALSAILLSGCNAIKPEATKYELGVLEEAKYPYRTPSQFKESLISLGNILNTTKGETVFQVTPIANKTGARELPVDLTFNTRVAVNYMTGERITQVNYDPETRLNNQAVTQLRSARLIVPHYRIVGSVVAMDKSVSETGTEKNGDIIFGKGTGQTRMRAQGADNLEKAKITMAFMLEDVPTGKLWPGLAIKNTIEVFKLNKGNDFGFSINGTGVSMSGRLRLQNGIQTAADRLVEYSILQLFGELFDVTYWLDPAKRASDPDVVHSLIKGFNKDKKSQVAEIQVLLIKHGLSPSDVEPKYARRLVVDGAMGPVTNAYIRAFIRKQHLAINPEDLGEVYSHLLFAFPNPLRDG